MAKTTRDASTKRDRLVRAACLSQGITFSTAATEMGQSPHGLHAALRSQRPRPPTIEMVRRWLAGRGILKRNGDRYTNEDLVG